MFDFHVVGGRAVREILAANRPQIVQLVGETYLAHYAGDSVNPNSYFLRFPEKPNARIIALPAYLGAGRDVAGIKWIGSFPDNIEHNIPRASATLLLNDYATGYPFACLEASQISAARTAGSAVLGAQALLGRTEADKVAVVGGGVIARNILEYFHAQAWKIGQIAVHDQIPAYGDALARHAREELGYPAERAEDLAAAIDGADVVVLATTSAAPYLVAPDTFRPGQVVLNISLRDISPEIILGAYNVLDDVDHCLTADTSPHLAEKISGGRDFVTGVLAQVLKGEVELGDDRPKIFSPFGLGVLDLAVGHHVYQEAVASGRAVSVEGFFGETERWGA